MRFQLMPLGVRRLCRLKTLTNPRGSPEALKMAKTTSVAPAGNMARYPFLDTNSTQTNGVLFHLTTNSSLPVQWSITPTNGGVSFQGGSNTGPSVYVLPGSEAGTYTVKAYSLVETNCSDTATLTVVKLELERLTFFPAAGYPYILRDDGTGAYDTNHWTKTTNHPIAYRRNTNAEVDAYFSFLPATFTNSVQIRGQGDYGFPVASCTPSNGVVHFPRTVSTNSFPNQVDMLSATAINWSFSVARSNSFASAGQSQNTVYLTLTNPTTANFYHTVVHYACAHTGATDESTAVANTWGFFSGRSATTWNSTPLSYYATSSANNCAFTPCLLFGRDGQCHSFCTLFVDALRANGVAGVKITRVLPPAGHSWFGVNHIGFAAPPTYPSEPVYKYAPGDLSITVAGIAGQNTGTPAAKLFNQHFIVHRGTGSEYYDPSYGVTTTGSLTYSANINAWCRASDLHWCEAAGTGFEVQFVDDDPY